MSDNIRWSRKVYIDALNDVIIDTETAEDLKHLFKENALELCQKLNLDIDGDTFILLFNDKFYYVPEKKEEKDMAAMETEITVNFDWDSDFYLGNALNYLSRAGRKDDTIENLQKAKQYIDFEIERLTSQENHTP